MTYFPISSPFVVFTDTDGEPLESGYIYIGEANQNPITNPINVYWDAAGLYPAAQPIRTIGGYLDRNGSPSNIYINLGDYDDYSIIIKDKHQQTVFNRRSFISEFSNTAVNSVDDLTELRSLKGGLKPIYIRGHSAIGDGGQGTFEWIDGAAPGSYVDNDGTIIVPIGGDGSGAWIRQYNESINIRWFNALPDGVTDCRDIIQSLFAISVANGEKLYIPDGEFAVDSALYLIDDLHIFGTGVLKIGDASAYNIFDTNTSVENVIIDGIGFDGSLNYPSDTLTTYKTDIVELNRAINLGHQFTNITIKNCRVNSFSDGGITTATLNGNGLYITGNKLIDAAYRLKPIGIYSSVGRTEATANKNIFIINNLIDRCGPTGYYDASVNDYVSSSDGIQFDGIYNGVISGNTVKNVASTGIRIEESLHIKVENNIVYDCGGIGINIYNDSADCVIQNNVVMYFGRIPLAGSIRFYSGSYYVAREFPDSVLLPLPADPSASAWWDVWPYGTAGIDTGTIKAYSATDYYDATLNPNGILPFRGNSGINMHNEVATIKFLSNTVITDGDASRSEEWGISDIPTVNGPQNSASLITIDVQNVQCQGTNTNVYFPDYIDDTRAEGTITELSINQRDSRSYDYANHNILNGKFTNLFTPTVNGFAQHKSSNNTTGSYIDLYKSRADSSAALSAGDVVGGIRTFSLTDWAAKSTFRSSQILTSAIGTQSATAAGGSIFFYATTSGTTSLENICIMGQSVLTPGTDNTISCGSASKRWSVVYAATGTINTSDDRLKTYIDINDVEKSIALEIKKNMRKFKLNSSINEKGDGARIHFGASAQTIKSIFESHGLDAEKYGLFCYDEWESQDATYDEDGTELTPKIDAGSSYGIRYDELLCFIIAAL